MDIILARSPDFDAVISQESSEGKVDKQKEDQGGLRSLALLHVLCLAQRLGTHTVVLLHDETERPILQLASCTSSREFADCVSVMQICRAALETDGRFKALLMLHPTKTSSVIWSSGPW